MRCPSCLDEGTLTCATCKNVQYCSRVCQQSDWQFHRHLCKSFQSFQDRLSLNMRRVIFFPAHENAKPEFAWLPVRTIDYGLYQSVDKEPLMGDVLTSAIDLDDNRILGVRLNVRINLCYDDDFLANYSTDNAAIRTATAQKSSHPWRGPILAFCGERTREEELINGYIGDIVKVTDMDMSHYSDVVALLIDYQNRSNHHQLRKGPKVQGVRAHCVGAQSLGKLKAVMVPRMHPIFHAGELSDISEKVGMSLRLRKDSAIAPGGPINQKHSNPSLTSMMLECDLENVPTFGRAPPHWQAGQIPNTLIVRQDRKPLRTDLVEAFGDFCQKVLQPEFERVTKSIEETDRLPPSAKIVMAKMTLVNWTEFLSTWKSSEE